MPFVIGDDDTLLHPEFREASAALASLISACRRTLWLRVPELDGLTADNAVCDALKNLALSSEKETGAPTVHLTSKIIHTALK